MDDGAIPIGGDDPDGNGRHEDGNGLDRDDALAKPLHVRPEGPLLVEGLPQRYWKRAAVGIEWNGGRREKETASSLSIDVTQMCYAFKEVRIIYDAPGARFRWTKYVIRKVL